MKKELLLHKILLSALILLLPAEVLRSQQVNYPDYDQMKMAISKKMMEFREKHPSCLDINQVRENLLDDMNSENKVYLNAMPARRKKVLNGIDVHRLCKRSILAVCAMDYRPQMKDYWTNMLATAVVLTEDGVCATNYHVFGEIIISGALSYTQPNEFMRFVMDADGEVYPVEAMLAADPLNDFVIFKVNTGGTKMTAMPLGESAPEGEEVYCLSHPQGNLYYLTKGIVSRNRTKVNRYNGQGKVEMQISADYAVGSSGGPIFDCRGNLVGLVSSTHSVYADPKTASNFQMTFKNTVPVKLLKDCIVLKKE